MDNKDDIKVAEVGEAVLYVSDLNDLHLEKHSSDDSTEVVLRFVNNWIRQQLLLQKIEDNSEVDLSEIDKKVENLHNQLLIYEFQKLITSKEFKAKVSEEEILDFYNNNKSNFELKQNIVKAQFIKVENSMPYLDDVKKWMRDDKQEAKDELNSYCIQFADSYFLNDTTWFNFNDIIKNTPFKSLDNEIRFLQTTKYSIKQDSNYTYLLTIKDFKIRNETSPMDFYKSQIEKTILNKQKQLFFEEYKKKLFEEAKNNNGFKIHKSPK
ncbi:MAG: hypothetical protein GY827_00955 [Cytophagales bacterium]|nr:hypothetical protein [Cytophagales bacterium]